MMSVDEPIEVTVVGRAPATFKWRGREYQVFNVLDEWESEATGWWRFSGRTRRKYYRVQAGWERHRITAELYASPADEQEEWVLCTIFQ